MLKKVSLLVVLALVLLAGTIMAAQPAAVQDCPCTVWVEPGGSIQALIDAAPPGSTICLPAGSWQESIVIRKPLTLRGQGPEQTIIRPEQVVIPERIDTVLWVRGSRIGRPFSVAVEGLTLIGRTLPGWGLMETVDQVLLVDGMARVVLYNCHIAAGLHGILLLDNSQVLVSNTRIFGEQGSRLSGSGVTLLGRSQAMIVESKIAWLADGITVERGAQVMVHGSAIERTMMGVYVFDNAQAIITHTRIANSEDGVAVVGQAQVHIANCTIVDNKVGVVLAEHATAVLTRNRIAGSTTFGVLPALHDPRLWFKGFIAGSGNDIPGPEEPGGNRMGAIYVEELAFLMTEEGGAWAPQ